MFIVNSLFSFRFVPCQRKYRNQKFIFVFYTSLKKMKFDFKWLTYTDHISQMLHEMFKSDYLTDVTLVCDDKRQFKAHKVILSACSPVFKNIIENLPNTNTVIYLRGVEHQQMVSILEFMYLGEVTFCQDGIDEFLNVAKDLEIKELSKAEGDNFVELKPPYISADGTGIKSEHGLENYSNESFETTGNKFNKRNPRTLKCEIDSLRNEEGKFSCNKCESQFTRLGSLQQHVKSIHDGIKYPCGQCEYQATEKSALNKHILSQHEGVTYSCSFCHYQASYKDRLKHHIESKHEGKKYLCKCEKQFNLYCSLRKHMQNCSSISNKK